MTATQPQRLTVSVIIPTYNRADLLVQAVASVLAQTRVPEEIIVVDDGSTDDMEAVFASFAAPVRVLRQVNQGVSAARNHGMSVATGDVFIYLDSDDLLTPRCVELCAGALEEHPEVGVVYSDSYLIDGQNQRLGLYSEVERCERPSGMILGELARRCLVTMSGGTVRRSALAGITFDESLPCGQDYDFWRQLAADNLYHYVDEPLSCYRYHGSQIIAERHLETLDDGIEVQRRFMAMPAFGKLPAKMRANVYCAHGVKNAIRGHRDVARRFFRRSIQTSPIYAVGYVLLFLSLLGDGPLRFAIDKRRQYQGNYIDGQTVASVSTPKRPLAATAGTSTFPSGQVPTV
jgi:glycosyltransferase involved in cell wall biosynthesis